MVSAPLWKLLSTLHINHSLHSDDKMYVTKVNDHSKQDDIVNKKIVNKSKYGKYMKEKCK